MLIARGEKVEIVNAVPPEDILSINTPEQLAEVEAMLQTRLQNNSGVNIMSHDDHKRMKIFSATGGAHLAESICKHLELPLASATVERFPDGEIIVKIERRCSWTRLFHRAINFDASQ